MIGDKILKTTYFYKNDIALIKIEEENDKIVGISFDERDKEKCGEFGESPLIKETIKQLEEYFKGKRKLFNLPIKAEGTEFQKKVWKELLKIPYGETCSYGEVAKQIGKPKASRAIGMANNKNPISIIIPCHRVIGASGKLVGYGGGIDIKEKLLKLERENKDK